jgi:hypothetical protein
LGGKNIREDEKEETVKEKGRKKKEKEKLEVNG